VGRLERRTPAERINRPIGHAIADQNDELHALFTLGASPEEAARTALRCPQIEANFCHVLNRCNAITCSPKRLLNPLDAKDVCGLKHYL
jgi:hypothetical protein